MSYQFAPGSRFRWQTANYQVVRAVAEGQQIQIEDQDTGERKNVEVATLTEGLFNSELRFVVEGRRAKVVPAGEVSTAYQYQSLEDCPPHLVELAKWQLAVIKPLLDMPQRTRAAVTQRIQEITAQQPAAAATNKISVTSVYRWMRDYEQGQRDLRALIPATMGRRGGAGQPRLAARVEQIIADKIEEVYLKPRVKTRVKDVHHAVAHFITEENRYRAEDDQLPVPSYPTLARRVEQLDEKRKFQLKHGAEATRKKFKQYGQLSYPETPLERVEIDHTKLDLIVLDADAVPLGRLTFTHCIDTATRYPLGYYLGFEPPSYLTVMECLKHAIMPKNARERYGTTHEWLAYGLPTTLVIDNGKEFRGHGLEDACHLLGIIIEPNKVRSPWQKAVVERFFRTTAEGIIHTLPGTTFSNVTQKGDYNSAKAACVFLDDIDEIVNRYLVDIYAQEFHRGLQGVPARQWEVMTQNGFFPALPQSAEELSILLCPFDERVLWHYGIEFEGLRYNSPELLYLRTKLRQGEKVKIKYDPSDLSQIYVHNPFDQAYITAPCLAGDYVQGLSLWKHRVIKQVARNFQDKVDLPGLWQARQKIQEIINQGLDRKKLATRSKVARYTTAGRATRDLETGARAEPEVIEVTPAPAEPAKPLPAPAPEEGSLFSLSRKPKEGWEIEEGALRPKRPARGEEEAGG